METAKPTVLIRMPMVMAYPTLKMTRQVALSNHPERPKASCNNPKGPAKAGSFFGFKGSPGSNRLEIGIS